MEREGGYGANVEMEIEMRNGERDREISSLSISSISLHFSFSSQFLSFPLTLYKKGEWQILWMAQVDEASDEQLVTI